MSKFIPREKLGKKARKKLDGERRATWTFSPVTKKIDSKKRYDRKKNPHDRYDDYGMGVYSAIVSVVSAPLSSRS